VIGFFLITELISHTIFRLSCLQVCLQCEARIDLSGAATRSPRQLRVKTGSIRAGLFENDKMGKCISIGRWPQRDSNPRPSLCKRFCEGAHHVHPVHMALLCPYCINSMTVIRMRQIVSQPSPHMGGFIGFYLYIGHGGTSRYQP
jgi:hypothetical protein